MRGLVISAIVDLARKQLDPLRRPNLSQKVTDVLESLVKKMAYENASLYRKASIFTMYILMNPET